MAQREALRELQLRLAERMRQAREQPAQQAWLAVECAGVGLLFPLTQAGEIFSSAELTAVPHAAPWFAGVANLRGGLYGVVDLDVFLGLAMARHEGASALAGEARLVALSPELGLNVALRVDRLAGLRSADQLVAEPAADDAAPRPAFAGGHWRDADQRAWQALDLAALARAEPFLAIAR